MKRKEIKDVLAYLKTIDNARLRMLLKNLHIKIKRVYVYLWF